MSTNGIPSLADSLHALEQAVATVPLVELPKLLGDVEKIKATGWTRIHAGPQNGQGECELLTVPEVAQRLKVSVDQAYELVRRGEIKKTVVGEKSVRVNPEDFAAYLAQQRA